MYPFKKPTRICRLHEGKTELEKINRFIKIDNELNTFIGLMYGDGTASKNKTHTISLAMHSFNDTENRDIFYNIARKFGVDVTIKERKLTQLGINSNVD